MDHAERSWADRHDAYWRAEGHDAAVEQLKGTCAFILTCQVAWVGLDYWAFRDHFAFFFILRFVVDVFVVGVLLKWRFASPNFCQLAVCGAVAAEILGMVYAVDRADSLYFAGLIFVLVGMPVLQPITVRGSVGVSTFCVSGFVAATALSPAAFDQRAFVIQMIFILSGALESAFSCNYLSKTRVVTFEQRKEIEAARDELASLDEAKDRFSANVHHELRTPLTLMLAPLESMLAGDHGEFSATADRTLQTMHVNGQRLLKLINNLLDLAKLESDRFSVVRRELDLRSIVEPIVEGARPMAESKGVDLSLQSSGSPALACVDVDALEKVVVNLVGNALKFTPSGGEVVVEIGPDPDEEGVVFHCRDSGIGLAAEDVDRVFDRFAQVDGSATREHEGTGIGLALARELVELHEGQIWAESAGVGFGTRMSFTIPYGEPDEIEEQVLVDDDRDAASPPSAAAGEGVFEAGGIALDAARTIDRWASREGLVGSDPVLDSHADRSRPRIVVADDNSDMRELLHFLLSKEFSVSLARNGAEAFELAKQLSPSLVVTDIMMPEMSGTELCEAIKSDDEISRVPVMLVSSKAENEMKIRGLELGADDYVTKPFHPKELLARVRGLVKVRTLQVALEERNDQLQSTLDDLKAAEAQLVEAERLAAVGELAAGIAHEVNNPVNFAINAVRTMRREIEDLATQLAEATKRHLAADGGTPGDGLDEVDLSATTDVIVELGEIVLEGLERTQSLVGDLRDFASPGRGEVERTDLRDCVESTAALVLPAFRERGVSLKLLVSEELPAVNADRSAISQVVLNLLKNAGDAVADDTGCISLALRPVGDYVTVCVDDNGSGVSPEMQDRLFEPFATDKAAGTGTGLGLSVSRRVAREHGGDLLVTESALGGARFELRIPYAPI
ncbi:MAG: ATP-binding protein [bacterium]|nr:ATP-binding protein [bacterium]